MTGFVPCFANHGSILVRSNVVPSAVHTGCVNGCRDTAQKLKGSRLKEPAVVPFGLIPEPALAEYASSEAHSECVIYRVSRVVKTGSTYIHTIYRSL